MACPSSTTRPSPDNLNLLRHPRSFAFGGEMWKHQRLAASRRRKVAFGQRLYNVNEQMEEESLREEEGEGPRTLQLGSSASMPSLSTKGSMSAGKKKAPRAKRPSGSGFEAERGARERKGGGSGIGSLSFVSKDSAESAANDFNEKFSKLSNTRLHFGASIALQSLVTNDIVVVRNSSDSKVDGSVVATPCGEIEQRDVALLKMIEMEDPGSYKAVHFGDDVWLQIFGGTGEPSWKNGSVVGAKVHTATKLPTVPLDPTQAKYKQESEPQAGAQLSQLGKSAWQNCVSGRSTTATPTSRSWTAQLPVGKQTTVKKMMQRFGSQHIRTDGGAVVLANQLDERRQVVRRRGRR